MVRKTMETLFGEKWKTVKFDFEYTNDNIIEVSNYGRIRSFNKTSKGNILKASKVNGYAIIRLKFFKPRDEAFDKKMAAEQKRVAKLTQDIKQMKHDNVSKEALAEAEKHLLAVKKKLSRQFAEATRKRTINYQSLIHRLVANYFLSPPLKEQTIVAHLDYDKLNNRANNLRWMTAEENYKHQQNSPNVIQVNIDRKYSIHKKSKNIKLTITRVMLLKKMLNQGKPIKQLVKQFKITDTQILRIKRGENWPDIEAAN